MERLYTTELTIKGRKATYEVIFENELYVFHPKNPDEAEAFSIKREEDEWHPQVPMEESEKDEVVDSLERYLLSQH
jgi:hypothetical protein